MKTKRKIGKKLPVLKAVEDKVPIAWEKSKPIPDIPYAVSNLAEEFDWSVDNKYNYKVEYKISEEEPNVWESNGCVDDLIFGRATLQNVDFEWGKCSRPYRFQPKTKVCEKLNELEIVKNAKETSIVFEVATDFDTPTLEKCKIKQKKTDRNRTRKPHDKYEEEVPEYCFDPEARYNQEIEDFLVLDRSPLSNCIKYKLSEEESSIWGEERPIPEVVYEHAILQNVEFEWGTWARPVKIKPDVRGKDVEPQKMKTAEMTEVGFEVADCFPAVRFFNCNCIEPAKVRKVFVKVRDCKEEEKKEEKKKEEAELPNLIYKKPKFYCKTCQAHICNNCFTSECMDHVVQWLGNATFRCESVGHERGSHPFTDRYQG